MFVSSEMRDLSEYRRVLADRLREAGYTVVLFEDLGGRDEDAAQAYLSGVAQSDIYLGIVADRYGTMLQSGRSPTHEEYREARRLGRRISVWAHADGAQRQGNARDFLDEVRVFHTTGQFADSDDLAQRVLRRLAEIAADQESPWVKVGDAVFRVERVRDEGRGVELHAVVRDERIARYLEDLREDSWGRRTEVPVTTQDRSGTLAISSVVSESRSRSSKSMIVRGDVTWAHGRGGAMDAGTGGYSADDLTEVGLGVGLLGEELPPNLAGLMAFMVDRSDPLEPLLPLSLSESTIEAVARLLVVERLIGGGRATSVDSFELGPEHLGRRRLRLAYRDPQRYSDTEPQARVVEGSRPWS